MWYRAEILSGALSSAANYIFNIVLWEMIAYSVYQAQGKAVRVFCFGNAALALESVLGNFGYIGLSSIGLDHDTYMAACLVLTLAAVIVSLFIFPEHKINELLLPLEGKSFNADEAQRHYAPWKQARVLIAEEHGLSEREREVFMMLAKGKTTQQISDTLDISPYATRAHIRNIHAKIDVHLRTGLAQMVENRAIV